MHHVLHIIGNVGKDPEMRFTPSGQAVCSFSVASNRQYTNGQGEKVKETVWFRVSTWGKTAEIMNQYVKRGSLLYIEGRLTPDKETGGPRVWTKQDGKSGSSYEINGTLVRFLNKVEGQPAEVAASAEETDEFPF